MERQESPRIAQEPWFPLALLLASYAAFDFWIPAIADLLLKGEVDEDIALPLGMSLAGCVLAQLSAVAAWGVLGSGRLIARWLGGLLAASLLLGLVFTRGMFVGTSGDWKELLALFLLLPLAYLGVQIPLWAMSLGWGCRISTAAPAPQRITLRGLFLATAAVAGALAPLQIGPLAASPDAALNTLAVCLLGGSAWGLLVDQFTRQAKLFSRLPASSRRAG